MAHTVWEPIAPQAGTQGEVGTQSQWPAEDSGAQALGRAPRMLSAAEVLCPALGLSRLCFLNPRVWADACWACPCVAVDGLDQGLRMR